MSAFQILTFATQQALDTAANVLSGATMTFTLTGTGTPTNAYADKDLTIPLANPLSADAAGNFVSVFLDPTIVYRVVLKTQAGAVLKTWDPANENVLAAITSEYIGLTLDSLKRTAAEIAAGVTPVNYAYPPGHLFRYGSGFGVTAANDTAALLAMFNVCIKAAALGGASSCKGYIPAGTYKINEGVLAFDNNFTDQPWPFIETAGYRAVFFIGANFADEPMIKLTNGTATGTAGHYWLDGYLGGITFTTTRSTGVNGHGIALTGCWGIRFGYMYGSSLRGSVISMPFAVYAGTDPDPYAVDFCTFEGVEGVSCLFTVDNENGIGLDSCHFKVIRATTNTQGGFKNGGDGILVDHLSAGVCQGWAYDEGAGNVNRNRIIDAEIDGCQFGLRLNAGFENSYTGLRFIHRYQLAPNTTANYWPRICMDITGLSSPNLKSTRIQCVHRVNSGGAHKDLGVFCDFHSSAATFSDVVVEQNMFDNAGITYTDADFYRNVPVATNAALFFDGRRINDTRIASAVLARGDGTTSILNSGFNSTANIVAFPTIAYDPNSRMSSSRFIAPYTGEARFIANVPLTIAASTRVRMSIMDLTVNSILTTSTLVAGTGYTNGVYGGVILVGGTGIGAKATITVAGGVVTTVVVSVPGSNYTVGDVLTAVNQDIGGTGSGFSVNVASVTAASFNGAVLYRVFYSVTAAVQSYTIDGLASVVAGHAYCVSMDQNTAGNVAPSTPSGSFEADVYFHAEMINQP